MITALTSRTPERRLIQPQFGGDIRGAVADDFAPRVGQFALGDFRGDIGAFEKLLQQVAHQHCFGTSHDSGVLVGAAAERSCVTVPSATVKSE